MFICIYIYIYMCVCLCAYVCAYITHTDNIIYIPAHANGCQNGAP